jgi:transposase
MARLGMLVGHCTILREVKRSAQPDANTALVRVTGIDDWAWKKGMNYGTVIVDLERRQVVDVLPDRSAASTAEWLKRHPEIEMISRDRAGLYAEGARVGAPQARQVADRFHLLRNFREAVERQLIYPGGPVRRSSDGAPEKSHSQRVSQGAHRHFAQRAARAAQLARFAEIKVLYEAGESITAIARALGLGRRRVERWSRFIVLPERNAIEPKACTPAHFEALLSRRFTEGTTSVRLLFGEIKQQGYTGSYSHLARFIAPWKDAGRPLDFIVEAPLDPASPASSSSSACGVRPPTPRIDPTTGRHISPLTAAALCVKPRGQMTSRQLTVVDALKVGSEEFTTMRQLAMRFRGLFRGGSLEKLDEWLRDAFSCGIYSMRRFAKTLRQDKSAVQNAVTDPWSNGQTEGQINRLKTLKRSMYGRASIELLRARMLPLQEYDLHRE